MTATSSTPCCLATLELAGVRFAVAADACWEPALARYAPFAADDTLAPAAGELRLALHATAATPTDWDALAPLLAEGVAARWRGRCLHLAARSFRARVDLPARRVTASGPLHRLTVDLAVRSALPLALAPHGLLLHGALLADGDQGWLCCGPSGSGKSTLAGLLPAHACCDELAAARCDHGEWRAAALPWWNGRPASPRLSAVFLLRHGAADRTRRLPPTEAVRRLGTQVLWPPGAAAAQAFDRLHALTAAVPVWELAFRPTPDVLAALHSAASAASATV